ncbi:MAG: hypothetical protein ABIP51_20810 [Bacteroidia bacterium]
MRKIATQFNYDFYVGTGKKGTYYNIVPINEPAPKGGYYSSEYICGIKKVPNLFLSN